LQRVLGRVLTIAVTNNVSWRYKLIYQNGIAEVGSDTMMQKITFIFVTTFLMIAALAGTSAHASIITSQDGNTTFKAADASNTLPADRFIAASGNDAFISYNSFSDFVVDKPLQIFNLPHSGRPAADLIIIHADNVVLEDSIEISGPTKTDILIIERTGNGAGDGRVYCNNCRFSNINRITLGALSSESDADFSINMPEVGIVTPELSSKIIINDLSAPGALALETIFTSIENNGLINLNQNTSDSGVGFYQPDLNGDRTVGTGSVNLYLGEYAWEYETQQVTSVADVLGSELTLEGTINAPNVAIFSTYPLAVNTVIDTRTDILSTTMYRGEVTIAEENVTIATINMTASLTLGGSIQTQGGVDLDSGLDMSISSYSTVDAPAARIVVGSTLYNYGRISTDTTSIETGSLVNEGKLFSKTQVSIDAVDYVFNQYGGLIQSEQIIFESEHGVIRNGSKTPYRDTLDNASSLLTYTSNFLNILNSTQIGAFYQSNVDTSNDSLVLAPKTTAHILGNRVEISGAAFENINPYYIFVDYEASYLATESSVESSVNIDVNKATQILLAADEKLLIDVDNYILNSSALMTLSNPEGRLTLNAALVNNERYRVQSELLYAERDDADVGCLLFHGCVLTGISLDKHASTLTSVYSPPALISSLGEVHINATQSFLNNTAFLEVFGDLYVNSPIVNSLGYERTSLQSSVAVTPAYYDSVNGAGSANRLGNSQNILAGAGATDVFPTVYLVSSESQRHTSTTFGEGINSAFASELNTVTEIIEFYVAFGDHYPDADPEFTIVAAIREQSESGAFPLRDVTQQIESGSTLEQIMTQFSVPQPGVGQGNGEDLVNGSQRDELDTLLTTLFFVDGTIFASDSTAWFSNHNPLHGFAAERAKQVFSLEDYENKCFTVDVSNAYGWHVLNGQSECDPAANSDQQQYHLDSTYTVEVNEGSDELLISRTYDQIQVNAITGDVELVTRTSTWTRSLLDFIEQAFDAAVDQLVELYEEIKFW